LQFSLIVMLCVLGATRLGDFEQALRDFVVFRDGSTTVTGTLTAASGQWWIDQSGTLYVKAIRWQPSTEATVEELKTNSAQNEMRLWRPAGGEISMLYRKVDDALQLALVNYKDRVPGMVYDIAIISATDSDIKIGQFVQR